MAEIEFGTFGAVEMRVGTITKAEKVEKSEKLLRLEVFFGEHGTRVIMAGIAKSYEAEALAGKQVVAVMNLAPRKMMSIESHGMLLAADNGSGGVVLASCPGAPDGAQLG